MKKSNKTTTKKASTKAKKSTSKKGAKSKASKKITGEVQPEESTELYVVPSTDNSITTDDQEQLKNLKTFEELDFFLNSLANSGKKLVSKSGVELHQVYNRLPDTFTYGPGDKQMCRVQAISKFFTIE